ncbi:MAG: hypothetical protein KDB21_15505 [Acidimicrobiales bacterium]|nr:hypothetical protein [Acidimicrobiales bacterium]
MALSPPERSSPRSRRVARPLLLALASFALVPGLIACGAPSALSPGELDGGSASDTTAAASPTPTPVPEPSPTAPPAEVPQLVVPQAMLAVPGDRADATVEVESVSLPVVVELVDPPPGLSLSGETLEWQPTEPGTVTATIRATDSEGVAAEATVVLRARYPQHPELLVGLGDSVASGHGLELGDYLGGDDCWRGGDAAYPVVTAHLLVERGLLPPAATAVLAACSGATAEDLSTVPVGVAVPDALAVADDAELAARAQLDWAARLNPAVITLTVGANTLGFVDPEQLLDGTEIDWVTVTASLAVLEADLGGAIDRLVATTDSVVAVTGYYNPAAARPQGVDGCAEQCFAAASAEVTASLNATIERVAAAHPDRVVWVPLTERFAGHGAPNGLGPDELRDGDGPIAGLLGDVVAGVHPYCAKGDDDGASWLNPVDCVHPDDEGARQLAAAVADALQERVGPGPIEAPLR